MSPSSTNLAQNYDSLSNLHDWWSDKPWTCGKRKSWFAQNKKNLFDNAKQLDLDELVANGSTWALSMYDDWMNVKT